jgi:hypothetical protein
MSDVGTRCPMSDVGKQEYTSYSLSLLPIKFTIGDIGYLVSTSDIGHLVPTSDILHIPSKFPIIRLYRSGIWVRKAFFHFMKWKIFDLSRCDINAEIGEVVFRTKRGQ